MLFKKYSKGKRILIICGLSLIGLLLLLVVSAEYTSRPKFCTTCHYMEPFYESWATSTHKEVACVKCHYAPGFKSVIETKTVGLVHLVTYITEFYKRSKPTAEVSDASCLRSGCHEARLLSGREKFKRVYFDHAPHLTELRRGKKLRCTSCHSQIVQGDHMKVTESTCFLCHFKSGPGDAKIHNCTFCHDAPTRENSTEEVVYDHSNVVEKNIACERCHTEMIVGDGSVPLENCYNCHWEQDRLNRLKETNFMHKTHITEHKIECQQCHTLIQHKLPEKESLHLLDCTSCHVDPHKAQITLFTGKGGYNAHPAPNPMFIRSITCKGCHVFHEDAKNANVNGETFKASKKSCENCHGKGFDRLLSDWKNISQKKLDALVQDYQKVNNEIIRSSSAKKAEALKLLREAKYNIDLVEVGKSVHNVQFADELLRGAHEIITKSLNLIGSKTIIRPYQETSKFVPAQCNTCHFGVEVETKLIFGMQFSHKKHVVDRQLNCKTCHSNVRKHGELIMTKTNCATCHHNKETENCMPCHTLQYSVYSGTLDKTKYATIEPDEMFEAEVECIACHNYDVNKSVVPGTQSCLECHDEESYIKTYNNWRENSIKAIESIENWISQNGNLKLTDQQKDQVNWVKEVLTLVKTDNSEGVHNPKFYESVLKQCQDTLNMINPGSIE
jgi:nitrate/TMAO reductase-like tetraheme cytochrome c subunit